ncbi:hypothetical protein AB0F17_54040 [Nonomuraea sp. NPDC026600]|uniref:hypothetical protein n=1 Tax=Nonomuraea sp. NPDC026600 TaxID=3155363 RepID=UPI0033DF35F1
MHVLKLASARRLVDERVYQRHGRYGRFLGVFCSVLAGDPVPSCSAHCLTGYW